MNLIYRHRLPYPTWQSAFSEDALRRAWLPVQKNKGKGGSDGQTIQEFEKFLDQNITQLQDELLNQRYRPRKVTQVLVPKPSGGWRPLTLWAIRDRVAQRAVYNYLEPVLDTIFLDCSFGFRMGKTTKNAAEAIQAARARGANWVVDADIKDCFGQMKNKHLIKQLRYWQVPKPIGMLLRYWLEAKVWNAWRKSGHEAGTSQGGVISPLMCNLYLHTFDLKIQRSRGLELVRYADDFVILTADEKSAKHARQKASSTLKRIGLEIHPHKTKITNFDTGFPFVGWFFVRDEMYQLS